MIKLRSLWSGELALGDAFWTWAVTVGLVINLVTSVLFLVLILQDLPCQTSAPTGQISRFE
jgi:hypothetical protein